MSKFFLHRLMPNIHGHERTEIENASTVTPGQNEEEYLSYEAPDSPSSMKVYADRLSEFQTSCLLNSDNNEETFGRSSSSGGFQLNDSNLVQRGIYHSNQVFVLINESGNSRDVLLFVTSVILLGILIGCFQISRTSDFENDMDDVNNESDKPGIGWVYISKSFGYIYFLSWTISNWPQLLLNYRHKSTEGLSPDYVTVNCIGFVCYAVFNSVFYWNPAIQNAYADDHDGADVDIKSEDVFLALQTTVLVLSLAVQIIYYNVAPRRSGSSTFSFRLLPTVKFNPYFFYVIMGTLSFILGYFWLVLISGGEFHRRKSGSTYLNWTDFIYTLSYVKLFSTLTKYVPQILLNRKRRSTSGFNIWTVVFDCLGGVFSFLQVTVDSISLRSFEPIRIHNVKLLVGMATVIKNIILMMQHYIWYKSPQTFDDGDNLLIDDLANVNDHPLGYFALHCDDTEDVEELEKCTPPTHNESQLYLGKSPKT